MKTDKATRPDSIEAFILIVAVNEVAPALTGHRSGDRYRLSLSLSPFKKRVCCQVFLPRINAG